DQRGTHLKDFARSCELNTAQPQPSFDRSVRVMQGETMAEGCGKQFGVLPAQPAQYLPKPLRVSDPSLVLGFTLAGQPDTLASEIGWFQRLHTECVQAHDEDELRIIQPLRALTNAPRNPLESAVPIPLLCRWRAVCSPISPAPMTIAVWSSRVSKILRAR